MLSKFSRYFFSHSTILQSQLSKLGIKNKNIYRNLTTAELYEIAFSNVKPADPHTPKYSLADNGALVAYSGQKTGRSPKDKRIVEDEQTKKEIWWGDINIPISKDNYKILEESAIDYLNNRPRLYIVDGYAGWDPKYRLKIRIFCTRAYHALFMKNMLIVPTEEELINDFKEGPDYTIFNAGEFQAPSYINKSKTQVALNLSDNKMTILGTQYAGEMKKGVFSIMHYLMPKKNVLSMHCSATQSKEKQGDTTLLFGLSGTGKTTLSADPRRFLIGDDEHCWSDDGVFNIEGGCYAKCIDLSEEKEPDIFRAIKFGTVLENVNFIGKSRNIDFKDGSITENTRASYPLQHVPNAKFPAIGGHPKNVIFLTCDSFGVLPPVAKLTFDQAMYHFISGYTSKVAGTEVGIKEPQSTFSSCFGAAFLPLHPVKYAKMLSEKMQQFGSTAWIVNTGWTGGKYGVGQRMNLSITRGIIDAIHSGELVQQEYENYPVFNFQIPKTCPGVPSNVLNPRNTWTDKEEYDKMRITLAKQFIKNFKEFEQDGSREITEAGPKI